MIPVCDHCGSIMRRKKTGIGMRWRETELYVTGTRFECPVCHTTVIIANCDKHERDMGQFKEKIQVKE